MNNLHDLWLTTGFPNLQWQMVTMWIVVAALLYLAIVKRFQPLLLVPISLGALISNLPIQELIMNAPLHHPDGTLKAVGGLLWYLNQDVILRIFPPLLFLGVGALIDFAPLIAHPRTLLLGGAAQLGIFATFLAATLLGFDLKEAAAIGVIGGADGPISIFTSTQLAPHLLGAIAVATYSYIALVPLIQPHIMKLLTTDAERKIKMKEHRDVGQFEKIVFSAVVMILCILIAPAAAPLLALLFIGNILRECKVTDRLVQAAQNEIISIVTIFLGVCVGLKMGGFEGGKHHFLNPQTLGILALGIVAFSVATAGGVLMAKLMNLFSKNKINPLIGSAGVSAVHIAAQVSQDVGQKYDPTNSLLTHAMGPSVAGIIGSALAAGYFIAMLK